MFSRKHITLAREFYAHHALMNNLYMPHVTGEKRAVQMK